MTLLRRHALLWPAALCSLTRSDLRAKPPAPPRSGGGGKVAYPFGSRLDGPYPFGIRPNHVTNAQMDDVLRTHYVTWRNAMLRPCPTFVAHPQSVYGSASITDAYWIRGTFRMEDKTTREGTVSEGIGYGMLIMVIMAGFEPDARRYFDGLLRLARARPAYGHISQGRPNGRFLMDWLLDANMVSNGGGWNALDGDLDIAYALLMAHRQWGSTGVHNYRAMAIETIHAMKQISMAPAGEPRYPQQHSSRTSDYMPGFFRAFRAVTDDPFWDKARNRCASLLNTIIASHSPTARLMPDFITRTDTATPYPSPGHLIEGDYEGRYAYNAFRNPLRWGSDYIHTGDMVWHDFANGVVTTIKKDCGSDPMRFGETYRLDGQVFPSNAQANRYFTRGMAGCVMVGCMVNSAHQSFINRLWTAHAGNFSDRYYDSEMQFIPMLVASGNWWRP